MVLYKSSFKESPKSILYGALPINNSYKTQPKDHQSTVESYPWLAKISGAKYCGVPHIVYAFSFGFFAPGAKPFCLLRPFLISFALFL